MISDSLIAILPELFLMISAMGLLVVAAFLNNEAMLFLVRIATALVLGGILLLSLGNSAEQAFNGLLHFNAFTNFTKILVLIGGAAALLLSLGYFKKQASIGFVEYPVLILLGLSGMLLMISSNDLIAFYVGLELQSLCLYILASMHREDARSSEAGIKYVILGALASGILLYGMSLIYGFSGTTSFEQLATLYTNSSLSLGVLVGLICVMIGLLFKISAVPFHMWTPDVYEGAPTPVTAFFAVAPKVAALALLIRLLLEPFGAVLESWQQIIILVSILSMLVGAFAAILQENFKRLLAYSAIGHIGYALIGVASADEAGISAVLLYISIYIVMSLGAFAAVILMRRKGVQVENIADLSGVASTHPVFALTLTLLMLSLAGIPPLAGFFGKFYIFMSAIENGFLGLAIVGVLASVVAAYYYLRVIKVMYFDSVDRMLDEDFETSTGAILIGSALLNSFFFIYPVPLLQATKLAAAALF